MAAYDEYGTETRNYTIAMWYRPEEARGVGVLVGTGMLSLLSVVTLLIIMAVSAIRSIRSPEKNVFIRTHVAAYFVSLLLCDFAQGIGSLLNMRWISQGGVEVGSYCTAQAAIKQTGNVGTALWSFVIAVHTFDVLFLGWHIADYVCYGTLVAVWSFLGFIVILGTAVVERPDKGPFYGISGYWCWITAEYPTERYTLEYLFMFSSAGLSFVLYSLVFLRLRGNITVSGWRTRFHRVRKTPGQDSSNNGVYYENPKDGLKQVARQMLWYPVAYTILVLPIAAARFSAFSGKPVPFGVTIFTASIFMLSGFINAVLFTATRRVIPLPRSWKQRWWSRNRSNGRTEDGRSGMGSNTGPYITTTTMSQVDEPDSPTLRPPYTATRNVHPGYSASSPAPFNAYAPTQQTYGVPGPNSGQSGASLGAQQGQRPQWGGDHRRTNSAGSAGSSSIATLADPAAVAGYPLVQNASAEGRGYAAQYGRERSGSEGSVQYQYNQGYMSPANERNGSIGGSQGVSKALPSLPPAGQHQQGMYQVPLTPKTPRGTRI